ncbi:MAG: urease accessory protein UreH [Candidatus Woesearchaeota archaeon]|nr:urease accessory protein UreH [Candidatus Woesearchaeota archaeon]
MTFFSWELITALSLGFILGLKHALDADHVLAVTAITSKTKNIKTSSLIGSYWGFGHALTLLLVGIILLAFKISLSQRVALFFEFLVGIFLVFLGVKVLWDLFHDKLHAHQHTHNSVPHTHFHTHDHSLAHKHYHTSFFMGMIHGLAGSAALTLLVLASTPTFFQGISFIFVFGSGAILGMLLLSMVLALPFLFVQRFTRLLKGLQFLAGSLSILLGISIIYSFYYLQKFFL